MGWANASYKDAVIEVIGTPVANGKSAARLITPVADLSDDRARHFVDTLSVSLHARKTERL